MIRRKIQFKFSQYYIYSYYFWDFRESKIQILNTSCSEHQLLIFLQLTANYEKSLKGAMRLTLIAFNPNLKAKTSRNVRSTLKFLNFKTVRLTINFFLQIN